MIEKVIQDSLLGTHFRVYPFLPAGASEEEQAFAANVEAARIWVGDSIDSPREWRVAVNVDFGSSAGRYVTKDKTDALAGAIQRCWEWVTEQEAAGAVGNDAQAVRWRRLRGETLARIEEIDRATVYEVVEPGWWCDMAEARQLLLNQEAAERGHDLG